MKSTDRKHVLVAGMRELTETDTHYFKIRDLKLRPCILSECDDSKSPKKFASARAILIAEPPGKYGQLRELPRIIKFASREGLVIACWASTKEDKRQTEGVIASVPAGYHSADANANKWIYIHDNLEQIAEFIRGHDPGFQDGQAPIRIIGDSFRLKPVHKSLLRRAFWNASHLSLEKLTGGAACEGVYRVFATLNTVDGPREPMPFFFKVGSPSDIQQEYENYCDHVEPFVESHLRPGLIRDRCVVTPLCSAITYNFVNGATPLEAAISNGQATGVLYSLFETTLRGFRSHTLASCPQRDVVHTFIKKFVKVTKLYNTKQGKKRITLAKTKGLRRKPEDLEQEVAKAALNLFSLNGLYHGDLHIGNIMMRQRDAIVIDFGKVGYGPITADSALLEASIAFGTRKDEKEDAQKNWFGFVDEMYANPLEPPRAGPDHVVFSRVLTAIREIRQISCSSGVKPREIVLVLIASLLRYARYSSPLFSNKRLVDFSEERKAYALRKAEQLFDDVLPRYAD